MNDCWLGRLNWSNATLSYYNAIDQMDEEGGGEEELGEGLNVNGDHNGDVTEGIRFPRPTAVRSGVD